MRSARLAGLAFVGAFILALPAMAGGPGHLDPSFGGGDGMVTNDFGGNDNGRGVLVLPGGKIVEVGESDVGGTDDFAVSRYKSGGALDDSFGGDGRVITDFNGGDDGAWTVALHRNGKILVAGWAESGGGGDWHFAVARYRTNGQLDDGFGGDGRVTTPVPREGYAYEIRVLANGSFFLVGEQYFNDGVTFVDNFAVIKYKPNGQRDMSFGGDGKVFTDLGNDSDGAWDSVLVGNRLLVAGWATAPGQDDFSIGLARYRMNGQLDDAFSGDGKKIIDLNPSGSDWDVGLARLNDGRIVIAAHVFQADNDIGLVRIHPGGGLDTTFGGGDGKVVHDYGGDERAEALVRTGTHLVVGGASENDMAAFRFRKQGGIDTGFGPGTGVAVAMFAVSSQGEDVARHDGTVVVAGTAGGDLALARFLN